MLAGGGALVRGINDLLSDEQNFYSHSRKPTALCRKWLRGGFG